MNGLMGGPLLVGDLGPGPPAPLKSGPGGCLRRLPMKYQRTPRSAAPTRSPTASRKGPI